MSSRTSGRRRDVTEGRAPPLGRAQQVGLDRGQHARAVPLEGMPATAVVVLPDLDGPTSATAAIPLGASDAPPDLPGLGARWRGLGGDQTSAVASEDQSPWRGTRHQQRVEVSPLREPRSRRHRAGGARRSPPSTGSTTARPAQPCRRRRRRRGRCRASRGRTRKRLGVGSAHASAGVLRLAGSRTAASAAAAKGGARRLPSTASANRAPAHTAPTSASPMPATTMMSNSKPPMPSRSIPM